MPYTIPSRASAPKVDMSHVYDHLKVGAVFAANVMAWVNDIDAGRVVSSVSIVVVGLVTIWLLVWGKVNDFRNKSLAERAKLEQDIRLAVIRQEMEIEAERVKNALAIQAEQDRANQTSLVAQLAKLQASMDEAKGRVEDANQKLHKQAGEWEAVNLKHTADMIELRQRHEVDMANLMKQLAEANSELHELRSENRVFRGENMELMKRIASLQDQTNRNTDRAADNTQKIEGLVARTDDLAGKVAP